MMKKIMHIALAGCMLCLLMGCGSGTSADAPADTTADMTADMAADSTVDTAVDTTADKQEETVRQESCEAGGWAVTYEDSIIDTSMENAGVALGYSSVEETSYSKTAAEGKTFCFIKLKFEKKNSTEVVSWDKLILTDGDGNTYNRMDDTFIEDLGMKRLPGTDLNFGSQEGWICYEVDADIESLKLSYAFDKDTMEIDIL